MQHVIRSQQFNQKLLGDIFSLADTLEKQADASLQGKILASLFYEPSTRTRFSFESAMLRLGGEVLATEHAGIFSSAAKGETLEDTIRVVNHYADVIVLRHPEEGAARRAADVSNIPVINAGDGAGQHPTQALLDLYTIKRELGKIDGIAIAMVGDLKHGRTVRSLCYLLGKFKNIFVYFVSPKELWMKSDIREYLKRHEVSFTETEDLESVLRNIDVLYQTRIQKERFVNEAQYRKYKGRYVLTNTHAERMKEGSIIMHPLPRVDELLPEVDTSPKAAYFRQAQYGLFVRMALLKLLLKAS